jgi:parvulin-like peptidyl-prolyl isomerase
MTPSRLIGIVAALAASAAFAAKPVLRVNSDEITDVEVKLAQRAVAAQMQGMQTNEAALLRQTVDQVIGRTLILQAAREAKVTVDPKEVAATIEQQRQRAGGTEAFGKALAEAGLSEQDLARREQDRLMIQKYVEAEVVSKAGVTEQEVRAYYDGHPDKFKHPELVKLRMIFAQMSQGADQAQQDAAKARAEAARNRVLAGEDFAKVATETSDHPNKADGGALGSWVREAALPEFESALKGTKVGELTEVLKSQYGFFVFKVEDRRPPGMMSYDEVKENLTKIVRDLKVNDSLTLIVATRRPKAKIEALDPAIKAALEPPASKPPAAGESPAASTKPVPPAQPSPATNPPANAPKKP